MEWRRRRGGRTHPGVVAGRWRSAASRAGAALADPPAGAGPAARPGFGRDLRFWRLAARFQLQFAGPPALHAHPAGRAGAQRPGPTRPAHACLPRRVAALAGRSGRSGAATPAGGRHAARLPCSAARRGSHRAAGCTGGADQLPVHGHRRQCAPVDGAGAQTDCQPQRTAGVALAQRCCAATPSWRTVNATWGRWPNRCRNGWPSFRPRGRLPALLPLGGARNRRRTADGATGRCVTSCRRWTT